jgi:protein TonB
MVQQFGLARFGPDRRARRAPPPPLQPGSRPPHEDSLGERPNNRHIAASILFHLAVLFGIFFLPHAEPAEVVVPLVTLRLDENGAAGSAGGKAGGGGGGGHGSEASSAASQSASAEPPAEASEPTPPEASEPTPPTPTLAPPTPPTPTPPTPDIQPEPQVPQTLAPAPVIVPPPPKPPPPKPVVRPRPPTAKPTPHPPEKAAETPAPVWTPAPTVATQPPPGPSNGQGAPAANAQPGTAATGTASAGPGGAAGVGTGVAGVGPGAFGNGRGPGDDYLDRLRRHLSRFKRFPAEAVKRKQQGTVYVTFVLARDGTVLDAKIQRSSGFPLLDEAALDMLHRASPVPALPASYTGDRASLTIPADFSIGFFDRMFN